MLIDSHVNLHADAFDEDRDAVIERARRAGVRAMLAICSQWSAMEQVRAVCAGHADIFPTCGAHPHHAKDEPNIRAGDIVARAESLNAVAIGETGLDLHYNYSPLEQQIASFRAHLEAARTLDLPVIVHARNADTEMMEELSRAFEAGPLRILLHCYTSGSELAEFGKENGCYFSVNGIMTFKSAKDVRQIIADIMPRDRIILETDAPYLTPVPHRGRRNEPSFLPLVADALAALTDQSREEVEQRTSHAFFSLFDRVDRRALMANAD
jgi:TatD DNase family protein